jgi:hypothetical protein
MRQAAPFWPLVFNHLGSAFGAPIRTACVRYYKKMAQRS